MKQNSTLLKKKAMLEALEKTLGVVTTAAKMVGIERTTHYKWMESDNDYKEKVQDLQDVVLDFAESALHKMVENHNPAATLFLLKTKGKKRGYIERQEIEHSSDVETDITFEIHKREKNT
jgi:hypothetical protein